MSRNLDEGLLRALREVGFDVSGVEFGNRPPEDWRALIQEALQGLDGIRLWAVAVVVLSLAPVAGQERIM